VEAEYYGRIILRPITDSKLQNPQFGEAHILNNMKTALALVLADWLKAEYPDAQFFLDLRGVSDKPVTPAEAMAHVIRGYRPGEKLPERQAELAGLYRSVLAGQRALLLMDNAKDATQVQPLIPPTGCQLIVTSRQHFHLPGLKACDLDALPVVDAEALLLKIAPRIADQSDELAELCGYLPLALTLAGSAFAQRATLTAEQYVTRLQDAQKRLALVDAAIETSYGLIGPDARRCWRALAVFPASFDVQASAAVWEMEVEPAQCRAATLFYVACNYSTSNGPASPPGRRGRQPERRRATKRRGFVATIRPRGCSA
jgi:hypothetical protein